MVVKFRNHNRLISGPPHQGIDITQINTCQPRIQMAFSIAEHVFRCLQDFETISSTPRKLSYRTRPIFLDEFARFKLWSGNIGAHRKGRSSLDWRLRDASHLRDLVVNLLTDLKSTLHDVLSASDVYEDDSNFSCADSISMPDPEDSRSSVHEEDAYPANFNIIAEDPAKQGEIQEKTDQSAMEVTKHRTNEAEQKGENKPTGLSTESQHSEGSLGLNAFPDMLEDAQVLEALEDVADIIGCLLRLSVSIRNPAPHDHFMSSKFIDTSHFEEYDVEHVKAKLLHIQPTLAHRLGKAISQRRQYFRYREAHHQKLNAGLDVTSKRSEVGASTMASSIPNALKDSGSSHPEFSRLEEEDMSDSCGSHTSYATSSPQSGRLKIPSLPEQARNGPFECPFCYMMISVSTTIQWKKHVSADLRPYICLEPDCLTPEHQYTKRREWLNHMDQKHWRVFGCPYSCQDAEFTSSSDLGRHIRQSHSELSSHKDLEMVFDLCERPRPWSEKAECPLCKQQLYSKGEYGRHVGRHQTELALFALPHNTTDENEEDEEDSDENGEDEEGSDEPQEPNRGKFTTDDRSDSQESELSNGDSPTMTASGPSPLRRSYSPFRGIEVQPIPQYPHDPRFHDTGGQFSDGDC
ncbi:hypothetical protein F4803DRAFT_534152 [Xylaria telfairii]|nr:hypothetical protein F4803DRAFT_534152 [Xylaria telfairii]